MRSDLVTGPSPLGPGLRGRGNKAGSQLAQARLLGGKNSYHITLLTQHKSQGNQKRGAFAFILLLLGTWYHTRLLYTSPEKSFRLYLIVKQTGSERLINLPKVSARQVAELGFKSVLLMPKSLVFLVSLFSNTMAFSGRTRNKGKVGELLMPLLFIRYDLSRTEEYDLIFIS